MKHESRVFVDVEEEELPLPQVMVSRKKAGSSKSEIWRVFGVILAVALCSAAAVCFTLNKSQGNQEGGSVLRLTRDLSQANFTSKAAIHLTGGYDSNKQTLDWKVDQDQAFSSGGLKLVNGEIVIPDDGIYFVYSQVSFHISCTPEVTKDQDVKHISHAVMRYSDSYTGKMPLFSAIRSVCMHEPESEDLWYNTIYLGAAFHLREDDRLSTLTTKALLSHVESENGKTFFGVFAL